MKSKEDQLDDVGLEEAKVQERADEAAATSFHAFEDDGEGTCTTCGRISLDGVHVGEHVYETVDHPKHYNSHPAGIEAIDVIEHLSFNVGTAIKHLWRAGLKPGADQAEDIRKAIWYLTREVQRVGDPGLTQNAPLK